MYDTTERVRRVKQTALRLIQKRPDEQGAYLGISTYL